MSGSSSSSASSSSSIASTTSVPPAVSSTQPSLPQSSGVVSVILYQTGVAVTRRSATIGNGLPPVVVRFQSQERLEYIFVIKKTLNVVFTEKPGAL